MEEIKGVRHALLDLARALIALVNDAVARVRRQVQNPGDVTTAVAKRSRGAKARLVATARRVAS